MPESVFSIYSEYKRLRQLVWRSCKKRKKIETNEKIFKRSIFQIVLAFYLPLDRVLVFSLFGFFSNFCVSFYPLFFFSFFWAGRSPASSVTETT
ncbi:hypothetical protein EO93_14240 [Methanosarcina sp. 1.H.A.2.2]|nr:hypothetical protein EO93_14240 [Methanosarcina sp. 1.H.A.2.2]